MRLSFVVNGVRQKWHLNADGLLEGARFAVGAYDHWGLSATVVASSSTVLQDLHRRRLEARGAAHAAQLLARQQLFDEVPGRLGLPARSPPPLSEPAGTEALAPPRGLPQPVPWVLQHFLPPPLRRRNPAAALMRQ